MKKQSQQPNMDEWLLDALHGLETNEDEEQHRAVTRSDFLTPEAFAYFSAIEHKNATYGIERTTRRLITRSIWPRILVARINSVLSTALTLFIEGHWEFLKLGLSFIKSAQHYLGLIIHGLRLTMNVAHLLQMATSNNSEYEELYQYLNHS